MFGRVLCKGGCHPSKLPLIVLKRPADATFAPSVQIITGVDDCFNTGLLIVFINLYFLKNISFSENCLRQNLCFVANYRLIFQIDFWILFSRVFWKSVVLHGWLSSFQTSIDCFNTGVDDCFNTGVDDCFNTGLLLFLIQDYCCF